MRCSPLLLYIPTSRCGGLVGTYGLLVAMGLIDCKIPVTILLPVARCGGAQPTDDLYAY